MPITNKEMEKINQFWDCEGILKRSAANIFKYGKVWAPLSFHHIDSILFIMAIPAGVVREEVSSFQLHGQSEMKLQQEE